jgi:hypothetical protein
MGTIALSACAREALQSNKAIADVFTPTPQPLESTPVATSVNDTAQFFSSDELGLCFSYPQGYTQLPYNDTVQLAASDLPGSDLAGLFWLERSDAYDRTAEVIADQVSRTERNGFIPNLCESNRGAVKPEDACKRTLSVVVEYGSI